MNDHLFVDSNLKSNSEEETYEEKQLYLARKKEKEEKIKIMKWLYKWKRKEVRQTWPIDPEFWMVDLCESYELPYIKYIHKTFNSIQPHKDCLIKSLDKFEIFKYLIDTNCPYDLETVKVLYYNEFSRFLNKDQVELSREYFRESIKNNKRNLKENLKSEIEKEIATAYYSYGYVCTIC